MATLREIRDRISSIKSTQQITKAMKMVAAAKLRKAQDNIISLRPYAFSMRDVIGHLTALAVETGEIPLMQQRPVERVLLVVVTADRGLCGAFNSNIIRQTTHRIEEYKEIELELYPVGRKGYEFFSRRSNPIKEQKINFFNFLAFEHAVQISKDLITYFRGGDYDRIEIVYNEFKSVVQQNIIIETFLPFTPDPEMLEDKSQVDFLYEPDKESILNVLIPKHLNTQIWRILLESYAAEQGARMTAMESATDNAEELVHNLTIYYNRTRQAAITKEIAEIVGGAEALKES